jgi:hypothetical protein
MDSKEFTSLPLGASCRSAFSTDWTTSERSIPAALQASSKDRRPPIRSLDACLGWDNLSQLFSLPAYWLDITSVKISKVKKSRNGGV